MAQTIAEHLMEQGEARGMVREARRIVRLLLEVRFGPLPEAVLQRIEACNEVEKLEEAGLSSPQLQKLDDLQL
jgi:hypothetical protein